jgi:hypothetical protein
MKRSIRSIVLIGVGLSFGAATIAPAWADEWSDVLTPIGVAVQNISDVAMVEIFTFDPVQNPAGCVATDGYFVADPLLENASLAMIQTAIVGKQTIKLYISSTQCTQSRPTVSIVYML